MGIILNDARAKYKTKKTLLQTLIDNCPMSDNDFDDIIEAYESTEEEAMSLMIKCEDGKFERNFDGGWNFEPND